MVFHTLLATLVDGQTGGVAETWRFSGDCPGSHLIDLVIVTPPGHAADMLCDIFCRDPQLSQVTRRIPVLKGDRHTERLRDLLQKQVIGQGGFKLKGCV